MAPYAATAHAIKSTQSGKAIHYELGREAVSATNPYPFPWYILRALSEVLGQPREFPPEQCVSRI
jgi:hypothetical protein